MAIKILRCAKPGHKLFKPIRRGFIHLHSYRFTSLLVNELCMCKWHDLGAGIWGEK